ncbi:CHAP domain-containing protein [Weissella diestrammenae]|uniref:CHAP domain-containing protein n=1 Tax=Weissella diestrammenae TaxID=1162633 RepID=A0A7G9T6U9_9LACO|nr:CHAP domain-containing protein [Weissella diestrammenae]MCM0582585.1 CHAP domain-containing protein [Weissella diestrammenae]QNN75824.1 CHAP domain-containing protein [Weissella diestrammenae]
MNLTLKASLLGTFGCIAAFGMMSGQAQADSHKVVAGDTVYDIAMTYGKTVDELVTLNQLDYGGALIYVGNEIQLDQTQAPLNEQNQDLKEATLPTEKVDLKQRTADLKNQQNSYPYGQCTWYVKAMFDWAGSYWGNAADWADSARRAGLLVDGQAAVGSIAVFAPGSHGADKVYGHVAIVEKINDDGTMLISEGNAGKDLYSTRVVPTAGVQFIHHQ